MGHSTDTEALKFRPSAVNLYCAETLHPVLIFAVQINFFVTILSRVLFSR